MSERWQPATFKLEALFVFGLACAAGVQWVEPRVAIVAAPCIASAAVDADAALPHGVVKDLSDFRFEFVAAIGVVVAISVVDAVLEVVV